MRLTRSGVVPPKFSCHLGRHGVIKKSNTWLDKVSFEMSDVWPESTVQCRGKSTTASVPSDASKTKKISKRVSKDVRKSLVEKYVDKYRIMNAGKFPTASVARKNVGGCYYVVRQILQELEYNSSLTVGLQEVSRAGKPEEVINSVKPSTDVLPGSDSRSEADNFDTPSATKLHKESELLTIDTATSRSQTEAEEGSPSLISVEGEKSKDSGTQYHHATEITETNLEEKASEDFLKYDQLNPDYKKQKSRLLDIQEWETHKLPGSVAEPENKSSMWQNLKSFANGILGMWRRS